MASSTRRMASLADLDLDLTDLASRLPRLLRHECRPSGAQRLQWLAAGAAGGAIAAATATFLLDPDRGRARRTQLEQRGGRLVREGAETARKRAEDAAQRAVGRAREAVPEQERPGDAVLLERVRAEAIGPSRARNSGVVTTVDDGVVFVRGQVEATEQREDLLTRILDVDGVQDVVDLTHLPGEPAPTRA